jgi:hypothetical protein
VANAAGTGTSSVLFLQDKMAIDKIVDAIKMFNAFIILVFYFFNEAAK